MEYKADIEEEPMVASEPVGYAYGMGHDYVPYGVGMPSLSGNRQKREAEEFARKICFTAEEFEALKAHGFYQYENPEAPLPMAEESVVAELDAADAEGYVSHEEVEHLRNVWKHVG